MSRRAICFIVILCATLIGHPALSAEAADLPAIDAKADQILRQMTDYLKSLEQFSFRAENTIEEVLSTGQKLQFADTIDVYVSRPNRLCATGSGDRFNQRFHYDGKAVTLFDKDNNVYATIKAPGTIEEALDYALEAFNLSAPLSEIIYRNAYDILTEEVESALYVGLSTIRGAKCHHLAFRQKDIDWQIWVEDSKTPLPRKFIITEKWVTGAPQFSSQIDDWNTSAHLEDTLFEFVVPEDAERIAFLPAEKTITLEP
jgi:hypothetical protein